MPVLNPRKTVQDQVIPCGGRTVVTLSFDVEAELAAEPADLLLLMALSGRLDEEMTAAVRESARRLIRTAALSSGDAGGEKLANGSRMALYGSGSAVPFTNSTESLVQGLEAVTPAGEGSCAAAFLKAADLFAPGSGSRKLLVLFTDSTSDSRAEALAAEQLRRSGIELYCIALNGESAGPACWASAPITTHAAAAEDPEQLTAAVEELGADMVQGGARGAVLTEELDPEFEILRLLPPVQGSAEICSPQRLIWNVGTVVQGRVSLSFEIRHVGTESGVLPVNRAVTYRDCAGCCLDFPCPVIRVECESPAIYPEPCPVPITFEARGCEDTAVVETAGTVITSLGRIIRVDTRIQKVCPGRRTAVAVVLTELDCAGREHTRGTKTLLIPPQPGTECRDIRIRCITFVVPEALDESGDPNSLCNSRSFRVRVFANYADSDYVCCGL